MDRINNHQENMNNEKDEIPVIPNCPDCKTNEFVDYSGDDRLSESGEIYDVKVYKCHKCECEFDEEEKGRERE